MEGNVTFKQLTHHSHLANGSSALMTSACGVSVLFSFCLDLEILSFLVTFPNLMLKCQTAASSVHRARTFSPWRPT